MGRFSVLMREQRLQRRLTLSQLANDVGFHASYLSLVERGLRHLDDKGVIRIAQALGLDPTVALTTAIRDRLPEELHHVVPGAVPASDGRARRHLFARELQAEHHEVFIDHMHLRGIIDWDHNLQAIRTLTGCRPNTDGRPVWKLRFNNREPRGRLEDDPRGPKFAILSAPGDLEYHVETSRPDNHRIHHDVLFPHGWAHDPRRDDNSLDFTIENFTPKAFPLDKQITTAAPPTMGNPFRGALGIFPTYHVNRLELTVEFPQPYEPESWEAWSYISNGSLQDASRNVVGKNCSSHELIINGSSARLIVDEPLLGYTYSLVWVPADRQRYLEAKHGFVDS